MKDSLTGRNGRGRGRAEVAKEEGEGETDVRKLNDGGPADKGKVDSVLIILEKSFDIPKSVEGGLVLKREGAECPDFPKGALKKGEDSLDSTGLKGVTEINGGELVLDLGKLMLSDIRD